MFFIEKTKISLWACIFNKDTVVALPVFWFGTNFVKFFLVVGSES